MKPHASPPGQWPGGLFLAAIGLFLIAAPPPAIAPPPGANPNTNLARPVHDTHPAEPIVWFKLDEGKGDSVADALDARNAGELIGDLPPQWIADGISGSALGFDGGQGGVQAADGRNIRLRGLTISLWVRSSAGADGPLIAKWPEAAPGDGYKLSVSRGRAKVELMLSGSRLQLAGETAIPQDGSWHHLSATYNGTMVRLFVDGEPDGLRFASGTIDLRDTPLLLGRNTNGESFVGGIDDVRVYDFALTSIEVATLFAMDSDGDGIANVVELQRGLDPDHPDEPRSMAPVGSAVAQPARAPASAASALSPGGSLVAALSAPATPNHLLRIERDGANMRLSWRSTPGRLYRLQARDDLLAGGWSAFADVVASGNTAHRLDVLPLPPNRFYRLVLPDVETTLYEPPQPAPGEPCNCGGGTSEMPYLHLFSGESHYSEVDLRIKGRGLDFIWARKYRSRLGPNTAQGNGWDFSYNIRIQRLGQDIEVFDGNTRQDIFRRQPDGTYVADEFFREGTFDPSGIFTLKFADTGTWTFFPLDGSPEQGKIGLITDRNGNELAFVYDGTGRLIIVNDTLGRNITIAYNADGFIDTVTDFTGRQVRYSYYQNADAGGSFGDLKSVRSPAVVGTPNGNDFPAGKTTVYTYSEGLAHDALNHNLLTVTDPKGQPWLHNVYGAAVDPSDPSFDRLESQAMGASTEKMMLFHVAQTPTAANGFAVMKTILNDRVGNVSEYLYDAGNRLVNHRAFTGRAVAGQVTTESANRPTGQLRPSDPAFFETRMEWNVDSLPTRIVHPNGNSVENTYELALDPSAPRHFRGNLRTRRQLPGPLGGDQTEIVEQFEYATGGGCCGGENFATREVDGRGNETNHSYDSRGNRIHTQRRIPGIVEDWEYNAFGQMTAHVLPDNGSSHRRRDEFSYYAAGPQKGYLQQQVVDAGGLNLTSIFEYNGAGHVVRHIDPRGHDMLYALNALDQIVRETSCEVTDGSGIRYQRDRFYDANNNLVRTDAQNIDDAGALQANTHFTTTFDYEILNRLIRTTQEVDPGRNIVTEYAYDGKRNRTLIRHGEAVNGTQPANTVTTLYDERDLPFREICAAGSAGQSTNQSDYDLNGNLTRTSGGLENSPRVTLHTYDGYNRRTATTDAMDNAGTVHYDANGNVVSERVDGQLNDVPGGTGNVRLSETTYVYDAMDRRTRRDVAFFDTQTQAAILDGQSTTQTFYSDNSQVIRVLDDHSHETLTAYDTANRTQLVTDAKGNTITYAYDANNRIVSATELDKSDRGSAFDQTFVTTYAYDNLNRLTRIVDNISNVHRYAYDSRSNRVRYFDARDNTIQYVYDGLNRLIETSRLLTDTGTGSGTVIGTIITSQSWDDSSRLIGQTDDSGNTTLYVYDPLDRRIMTDYADCTFDQTTYDVHDNATQTNDANSSIVNCTYDQLDRVVGKTITPGPGVFSATTFESYQYDGLSRVTRAADNDSLVTRGSAGTSGYDSLSNVLRETQRLTIPAATPPRTITAEYDGEGNQTELAYPSGRVISRSYDSLDRTSIVNDDPPAGNPPIAVYFYIGRFRVEQRNYPKLIPAQTIRLTLSYDGMRRITGTIHNLDPSGAATPIDHRFYDWDPMHNRTGMHQILPGPAQDRFYAYDSVNRLVQSQLVAGGPPSFIDYLLDGVSNRQQVIGGLDTGAYIMDPTLCAPGDFQMNQYSSTPFDARTYDANGNLIGTTAPQNLSYDYRNQLVQFVGGGQNATYRYDCFGRRIEKNVNGTIARFYYDGAQEIEEQDSANSTAATYVYSQSADMLQMARGGQKYFFHEDDQGSAVKITDASGNLREAYSYKDYGQTSFFDQFGNPISHSIIGNPYLFQGFRLDAETALYGSSGSYFDTRAGESVNEPTFSNPPLAPPWWRFWNPGYPLLPDPCDDELERCKKRCDAAPPDGESARCRRSCESAHKKCKEGPQDPVPPLPPIDPRVDTEPVPPWDLSKVPRDVVAKGRKAIEEYWKDLGKPPKSWQEELLSKAIKEKWSFEHFEKEYEKERKIERWEPASTAQIQAEERDKAIRRFIQNAIDERRGGKRKDSELSDALDEWAQKRGEVLEDRYWLQRRLQLYQWGSRPVGRSDRNAKRNFSAVDTKLTLDLLATLPITTWSYKDEDSAIRHIGPMAQDFSALFGVGADDKHVNFIDLAGVSFSAIQGLHQIVLEKDRELEKLRADLQSQKQELDDLKRRLKDQERMIQKILDREKPLSKP